MQALVIALAALIACALRGFQSRSAAKRRYVAAFIGGGLMALAEGTLILMIAKANAPLLLAAASIGAACGWVIGIYLNHVLFKRLKRARKARGAS